MTSPGQIQKIKGVQFMNSNIHELDAVRKYIFVGNYKIPLRF